MHAIPTYLVRFDDGHEVRFIANCHDAAREYVTELMQDDGVADGEGASLYLVDEGGRGDEEFVCELVAGSPF